MAATSSRDAALVESLCAHFRAATSIDEREQDSIAEFVQSVPQLVAPFSEHADIRHVTTSALVVGRRGVVLHLHKRLGLWLQPGGHIDDGEAPPPPRCARRTKNSACRSRTRTTGRN